MPIAPEVVESVSNVNMKAIGDAPALAQNRANELGNLALSNAVAFQQALGMVFAAAAGKMAETLVTTDAAESGGLVPIIQQALKGAQSSRPETAGSGTQPTG